MSRSVFALLMAVLPALSSSAGVIITGNLITDGVPTVGLSGYRTYTFKASTDDGSHIVGFDFASQPSYGIFGPMNQVNPFGLPTVFSDNNAAVGAVAHVSQDSQFLFNTASVTVPAGFASESNSTLRAVFAAGSSLGTTNVPFVQIVKPPPGVSISFAGTVTVNSNGNYLDIPVQGTDCLGCIPPIVSDVFIDNVNSNVPGFVTQNITFSGLPGNIINFRFDSYVPALGVTGTGPAIPATFDYGLDRFYWNTVGSPLGTYKWLVTAIGTYGTDDGSITVRITVPEPTMLALAGVAIFANLLIAQRRPLA